MSTEENRGKMETGADMAEAEVIQTADVTITDTGDAYADIKVKNSRIGRVLSLKEETERQNELERQRSRRIRQEQQYIDEMLDSVETNLKNTKEEQKYNEEFERHIRAQVYRMHDISEDKLAGMEEARRSWYQGAAFALFFLSLVLIALCGILHGFGSEICIFMAFYTAIEGTLLSNGRKQAAFFSVLIKVLYLLLFPVMMIVFVCYELGFAEYEWLVPVFTVSGVVVLMFGAVSYFIYDPYRVDRRNRRTADRYIRDMERAALKEVRLKEKAYGKLMRKNEKKALREEKRQNRIAARQEKQSAREMAGEEKRAQRQSDRMERKDALAAWWQEKCPWKKKVKDAEPERVENSAKDAEPEHATSQADTPEPENAERAADAPESVESTAEAEEHKAAKSTAEAEEDNAAEQAKEAEDASAE